MYAASDFQHHRPTANFRKLYPIIFQSDLIITLAIIIAVLRAPIEARQSAIEIIERQHEIIQIEDIEQTLQRDQLPPPPGMPPPIEVSDDYMIENVEIDLDINLDLDRTALPPPPPPPPPPVDTEPPPPAPERAIEDEIFEAVEQMPELIGGLAAVQALIRYPEMARLAGIEGVVHVQFVVDENGYVTNPVVIRGVGGGLDEAAIDAVLQVRFQPGMQRGRPVKVRYAIPIRFRLQSEN